MDVFPLFLFTHENNEIKSPTKINDFTVPKSALHNENNKNSTWRHEATAATTAAAAAPVIVVVVVGDVVTSDAVAVSYSNKQWSRTDPYPRSMLQKWEY